MFVFKMVLLIFALLCLAACGGGDSDENGSFVAGDQGDDAQASSCQNVVIANGFAYAACGTELEVANLVTDERNLLLIAANDITVDADAELLFTQAFNVLNVLSIADPMQPVIVATLSTNFQTFSGLSAANGVLVVSGGASAADTQLYSYSGLTVALIIDGIAGIDSATGNPDVHVVATADGINAFYSQDIGFVANFAIQIASFNTNTLELNVLNDVVLTPGAFSSGVPLDPANFPVESEFLNDRLYVAHFAAQGVEVIDLNNGNSLLPVIDLAFEPTNIATDGASLFVVGAENNSVSIIDPVGNTVIGTVTPPTPLLQPTGVAASTSHIAIADRQGGLVIIAR